MDSIGRDQPRRSNGQYAGTLNTPPETTLAESATGSFLYPPVHLYADEHIAFFEESAISDRVLSNASHSYKKWRMERVLEHVREASAAALRDPQSLENRMQKSHGDPGYRDALNHQKPARVAAAEAAYPLTDIPSTRMRTILRAHQMWRLSPGLADGEDSKVDEHEMELLGQTTTVAAIVESYRTRDWVARALTENDFAQTEALERVAGLLALQQGIQDYNEFH